MSDLTVDDFLSRYTRGKVNLKDMNPYYKNTMATLIMEMPEDLRGQVQITSGHRSAAHQASIIRRKYKESGRRPRMSNLGGGRVKMHGIPGIVASVSGRFEGGKFVPETSHSNHGHGAAFDITGKTGKGRRSIFAYMDQNAGKYGVKSLTGSAKKSDPYHWQVTDKGLLGRDGSKMQGWRNTLAPPDPIDPHAAQQDKPFIDPHMANSGAKPIPKNDLVPPSENYDAGEPMFEDPDYDWGAQSGGQSGGGGFSMPQAQQVAPVEMQSWQGAPLGGQPGFNSSQGGNALMQGVAPMNMMEAVKLNKNMMV